MEKNPPSPSPKKEAFFHFPVQRSLLRGPWARHLETQPTDGRLIGVLFWLPTLLLSLFWPPFLPFGILLAALLFRGEQRSRLVVYLAAEALVVLALMGSFHLLALLYLSYLKGALPSFRSAEEQEVALRVMEEGAALFRSLGRLLFLILIWLQASLALCSRQWKLPAFAVKIEAYCKRKRPDLY